MSQTFGNAGQVERASQSAKHAGGARLDFEAGEFQARVIVRDPQGLGIPREGPSSALAGAVSGDREKGVYAASLGACGAVLCPPATPRARAITIGTVARRMKRSIEFDQLFT
jgi:hypothetical protein